VGGVIQTREEMVFRVSFSGPVGSRYLGLAVSRSYTSRYYSSKRLPLEGIKVVDISRVLAGPYCTQILGDMGAEVIKIEHPTRGDDTRAWGPPFAERLDGQGHGESAYFLCVNRNKKSIGLDFQNKKGQEILKKLIKDADILVENFVPGTLAKYGLSYEDVRKINERIIYTSVTGYGQYGPYTKRPGYDVMVEAEFGLMHITGEHDGQPVKVGVAVTDMTTGLYASNAILASLIDRSVSGRGQHLDVCLSDCQTATLANIASSSLISGKPDNGRWGTAHPSIVPYQAFETKGGGSIVIGGGNDNLFRHVCDAIGVPEWKSDNRFLTNALRVKNRDALISLITEVTKLKTTEEWLQIFDGRPFPYAAVNDVLTTLNHPHTLARNMVVTIDHPTCGPIKLLNSPVKFSGTQPEIRTAPPTLGEHSREIMTDLGFSESEVEELESEGVISSSVVF
jgi:succinate---hydroxymethylglutarate CoA-transferase